MWMWASEGTPVVGAAGNVGAGDATYRTLHIQRARSDINLDCYISPYALKSLRKGLRTAISIRQWNHQDFETFPPSVPISASSPRNVMNVKRLICDVSAKDDFLCLELRRTRIGYVIHHVASGPFLGGLEIRSLHAVLLRASVSFGEI